MFDVSHTDAYPELVLSQLKQLQRERDLEEARRQARRDRVRGWLRRGYTPREEVR